MTIFQSSMLIVFCVLAYMIIVDQNVAKFIVLWMAIIRVNTERLFWIIKYHPNNFVTTWLQNRKYDRLAKELEKEFSLKTDE